MYSTKKAAETVILCAKEENEREEWGVPCAHLTTLRKEMAVQYARRIRLSSKRREGCRHDVKGACGLILPFFWNS